MNVAKWLLLGMVALPVLEVAVFIMVAAAWGFFQALGLVVLGSLAGVMVLRRAGGNHIARVRVAMSEGSFSSLQADSQGGFILLAGILFVIPGLITDALGVMVLLVLLWQSLNVTLGRRAPPGRTDGVLDLEPEQWRRVEDPALPRRDQDDLDR